MSDDKLELVSFHLCPYVQRSIIVLLEKDIAHKRTYIDLSNKPHWFLEISPLGKVPVLRVDDEVLFESAVICEYLDEVTPDSLLPVEPIAKAKQRAWIEFGSSLLNEIAKFYSAPDAETFEERRAEIARRFARLETVLGDGPFFDGERFSMVDAVFGPVFRYFDAFETAGDLGFFQDTPKVQAWRRTLAGHPSVRDAVVADFPERLLTFLKKRPSHLATLLH
ncbi:glutathione S-transferase family protein [Ferruginivarius sediminum]|uniref:glutathione transferase n=1 Tax=Ferruginivarius sediminum TaxID=2661937 RepID=A0A369TFW8_9PROT|nr:glutathione S-transferase family protein [Ferruginivarius sediminum]RDD63494.1 glutathione S-transferase family protein [Ferruginivarius sediminum]